jgi:quercetin dioxygenase-like cupin family protein
MAPETCIVIPDLLAEIEIPAAGILSRTIASGDRVKAVMFGFDVGQELSEHTAAMPAVIHVLSGAVELQLGSEVVEAHAGTWVHMPAHTTHRVLARTPTVMLLLLLRGDATSGSE